jgi:hypothetical protein
VSADGRQSNAGPPTEDVALLNLALAARDVDAFVTCNQQGRARYDGRAPSEEAGAALLILHDCLNDLAASRALFRGAE